MRHTSDRDKLPEIELLKLHGLRITVEPYPNGIRALAVYKGEDRLVPRRAAGRARVRGRLRRGQE